MGANCYGDNCATANLTGKPNHLGVGFNATATMLRPAILARDGVRIAYVIFKTCCELSDNSITNACVYKT